MNIRDKTMWHRITDLDVPYRERLIVCYNHEGKRGVGEAYVHDGKWYWWDNTDTNAKVKVQEDYQLVAWMSFPYDLFYPASDS
jgi:hypothetical protein